MSVNLKGLAATIKNKLYNLRKKGIEVPNFKGYKNLSEDEQMNIIKTLDDIRVANNQAKRVQTKTNISKGYKNFLNRAGLIDNPINRQKYDDIKEYTKISRQIQKGLKSVNLNKEINFEYFQELANMTKYTNVDDYINNVPQQALKFNLESKITELKQKIDSSTLETFIKTRTTQLSEKQVTQLINKFNKLSFKKKVNFNIDLLEKYYQEYEDRKKLGVVDEYNLLKSLMESEG